MGRSHLNQKTHEKKCKLFARVCSQKVFKMSCIDTCTDTCLETLSPLVNCSVDNVQPEIEPYTARAGGKTPVPSGWGLTYAQDLMLRMGNIFWARADV